MTFTPGDKVRAISQIHVKDINHSKYDHMIQEGEVGVFEKSFIWDDWDGSERLEFTFPSGEVYMRPDRVDRFVEKIE